MQLPVPMVSESFYTAVTPCQGKNGDAAVEQPGDSTQNRRYSCFSLSASLIQRPLLSCLERYPRGVRCPAWLSRLTLNHGADSVLPLTLTVSELGRLFRRVGLLTGYSLIAGACQLDPRTQWFANPAPISHSIGISLGNRHGAPIPNIGTSGCAISRSLLSQFTLRFVPWS